mmetsp:Transcript_9474/g.13864  ORF Transcript_9474/g.13864 Transcript_9474/m.13864 type:complete len:84 (-) Transcript_9474:442-693(-)
MPVRATLETWCHRMESDTHCCFFAGTRAENHRFMIIRVMDAGCVCVEDLSTNVDTNVTLALTALSAFRMRHIQVSHPHTVVDR